MSIPQNIVRLLVRAYPNAARNEITGCIDGVLHIKISAAPLKGKANRELLDFLSRRLGISKSSIDIIKGHTSRNKIIAIDGLSRDYILKLLLPEDSNQAA
ncbi:DUF167 domain-containing protein [Chloroflexota bacterium]